MPQRYNGLGLRTLSHGADGADHALAYDGSSPGASLLASGGTLFTPGLMKQDTAGQHFYQADALGSVRGQTGNDQGPQGEAYYDAWGEPFLRQGSMPGPLAWAASSGYQTDADTGLVLLGNRYYDPGAGRFLSQDPSGDGDNWYAYCDNDPLDYLDPTGLTMQGAAPTGASFGNPMAQGDAAFAGINGLYNEAYDVRLNRYSDTTTSRFGRTESDSGWHLDWSIPLGDDYSGYFQLVGSQQPRDFWKELGHQILNEAMGKGYHNFMPVPGGIFGLNPRFKGNQIKTDRPGGRAAAKSLFRYLSKGKKVLPPEPLGNGGIRRLTEDGSVQIRMNPDGTTRVDIRGTSWIETVHYK